MLKQAIEEHSEMIAGEVLAVEMREAEAGMDWACDDDLGLQVAVAKVDTN